MKKLFFIAALFCAAVFSSCNEFDDSEIWRKLDNYEKRISALEELCKQINTNLNALQTIVEAVEKRDYVTNVSPIRKDGEIMGYTISFANSDTVTIYNGKDGADGKNGADGKDGYTPQIGVMKDTDNIYYWTLDGEWLLDGKGNKIKAVGEDGKDGTNGTNGKDGADGTDGITPRLKIEDDHWYISYDNGTTWSQLGKATGEDGDSFFKDVTATDDYVIFTLADGTELTVPRTVPVSGNKIYYTTSDGKKIFHNKEYTYFGALIVSNIYKDGQGVLTFDDTVTKIGAEAFKDNKRLTSITIPDSVTEIGEEAFSGCTSLTSITIPDGVTEIGRYAFYGCSSLTSVTIPDSVTEIGNDAFLGCTSLPIKNNIRYADTYAAQCMNNILSSCTFKEGTRWIGNSIFNEYSVNYPYLESITIPNSVISIKYCAFFGCKNLNVVYCKATVPPEFGGSIFRNSASHPTIYVPRASVDAYRAAEGWSEYANAIVGYDFE